MTTDIHTICKMFNCRNIHTKKDCYQLLQQVINTNSDLILTYDNWKNGKHISSHPITRKSNLKEIFNRIYSYSPIKGDSEEWKDVENAGFTLDLRQNTDFHINENYIISKLYGTFNVNIFELSNYSEIKFGNFIIRDGDYDTIYFNLENYFQNILLLSREIYNVTSPAYGCLGQMTTPFKGIVRKTIQEKVQLPVIHWVNYFGPQYVEKYGEDFLLNSPGYKKEKLKDGGIFLQLSPHFLIYDHSESPSEEEVIKYFTKHPKIKTIKYKPLFVEDVIPKECIENPPQKEVESKKLETSEKVTYTPEKFKTLAKDVIKDAKKNLEIKLNFKPKSVRKLDEAISKYFNPSNPPHPVVIFDFGVYLGEIIIKNLGGNWKIAENPLESEIVGLPNIASLRPIVKMAKRFENGTEDSIVVWYESIQRHVKEKK